LELLACVGLLKFFYFSSLCKVLFLQNLQNFFISSLAVCFFLFLVLV